MEYVITPAVVVGAMGFLMHDIVVGLFDIAGQPWWNSPVTWWAVFYVVFVGINIVGIEATMRFTVVINILALGILAFFFISVLVSGKLDTSLWTNITPEAGGFQRSCHRGSPGSSRRSRSPSGSTWPSRSCRWPPRSPTTPSRDIPRATIWGMTTLLVAGFLTLFLNTGVDGGAAVIGVSATPLFDGFKGVFGDGTAAELLALIGLTGLIASFFTIIYAYGRNTYSLSRAGYFPKWLSVTHGTRKTPHVALIAGAVVGYALAVLIYELGKSDGAFAGKVVGALLYMAVFGAVISYSMQCLSFILLRRKLPEHRAALPQPGRHLGRGHRRGHRPRLADLAVLERTTTGPGVYGTLIYFVLGIVYFAFAGRNRLVLSPEEEFALTQGEHGRPQSEGYGTTHVSRHRHRRHDRQGDPNAVIFG